MKTALRFVTLGTGLFLVSTAFAADLAMSGTSALPVVYTPYQSEIQYRTPLLPQWSFDLRYQREAPFSASWVDSISERSAIDSVRFSASRDVPYLRDQRIFASLQTSNDDMFSTADWMYLPSNAGVAASLGWQMGELHSFNMSVHYEYRQVGELNVKSLQVGVHYYF